MTPGGKSHENRGEKTGTPARAGPRQPAKERLDTLIHEALHHIRPDWEEAYVAKTSKKITGIIWKDRWRRVEK
jgi:hypothetical protein